jgi:hypothetical protein
VEVYDRADATLSSASESWSKLFQHWRQFRACDDGAIAEGYSDAVVKLLANRWAEFNTFASLVDHNPEFRRWSLGHIDESASRDDLKEIVRRARRCANERKATELCVRIENSAKRALAEQ